jgi:hypothetical protein
VPVRPKFTCTWHLQPRGRRIPEIPMNVTKVFCSGCQRAVDVVVTDAAPDDAQANVTGTELVCLDIGAHCTGPTCPLGSAEPSAMVHRLIRNGLPTERLTTVKAHCEACGLDTDFALYGEHESACLVCGTAR